MCSRTGDEAKGTKLPLEPDALVSHDANHRFEQTIAGLVHGRDVSVRLRNCIDANPSLGELTLREFLSDSIGTRNLLLNLRNLGRKTADELNELAVAIASEPQGGPLGPILERGARLAFVSLVHLLSTIRFPVDLLTIEMSVRLRNTLKAIEEAQHLGGDKDAAHYNLGAIVADWPDYRRRLIKQANVGRTTIAELKSIIEKIVSRRLGLLSACGTEIAITMETLSEERLDESLHQALIDAADCSRTDVSWDLNVVLHGIDPNLSLPPREHILKTVSKLPGKERDTITERFGLDGGEPQTLEQIASRVHVTRERVRQVEAKALHRLRIGVNRAAFERILQAEGEAVWDVLSDNSELVMPADLQERRRGISRHFALAIEVCHGRPIDWMNTQAQVGLGGWLRVGADPKEIKESVTRIAAWARTAPHPAPLAVASRVTGITERNFGTAARLRPEIRLFEGYVCLDHLGNQARRTCRLHRVAIANEGGARPFDICTLRDSYAAAYPDDAVSPRVIYLQLLRAPHLFFRLFDSIWICVELGQTPSDIASCDMPFPRVPMLRGSDFEAGSIGAWLRDVLRKNGPSRSVDLTEQAETAFSHGISHSSVGAVLQSNPDFVRVAPGVYGLHSGVADWSEPGSVNPTLLGDTQCRYYSMSRRAGDPIGIYPGWSRTLEMGLCRWASSNASEDSYRSLLAVAEPSEWPVDPDEVDAWQARKRFYGSYRLPILATPQAMNLPSAGSFLSSATWLALTGSIAWTTVNRTSQRRIDSQKAAATLALLVRFGMASPAGHWQDRHQALPPAAAHVSKMLADLSRTGTLSWDEGHLHALRTSPSRTLSMTSSSDGIEAMLAGGEAAADGRRMMEPGSSSMDLESLFGSDDWGSVFQSG